MSNHKKWITYLFLCLALTGCKEQQHTVEYLLENPSVLEKELQRCMSEGARSDEQIAYCKVAVHAQDKIRVYLEEQQIDPEGFGQRILIAEENCAQLKLECNEVKILLAVAGLNSPE